MNNRIKFYSFTVILNICLMSSEIAFLMEFIIIYCFQYYYCWQEISCKTPSSWEKNQLHVVLIDIWDCLILAMKVTREDEYHNLQFHLP